MLCYRFWFSIASSSDLLLVHFCFVLVSVPKLLRLRQTGRSLNSELKNRNTLLGCDWWGLCDWVSVVISIRTSTCRFQASMFFRCALVKWSDTFLWLAALKTFLIWLTGDDGRRAEMIERVLFIRVLSKSICGGGCSHDPCTPDRCRSTVTV